LLKIYVLWMMLDIERLGCRNQSILLSKFFLKFRGSVVIVHVTILNGVIAVLNYFIRVITPSFSQCSQVFWFLKELNLLIKIVFVYLNKFLEIFLKDSRNFFDDFFLIFFKVLLIFIQLFFPDTFFFFFHSFLEDSLVLVTFDSINFDLSFDEQSIKGVNWHFFEVILALDGFILLSDLDFASTSF